jgi:RNA exonuclease 1
VLTENQLEENSFPKWMPNSGHKLALIPNFVTKKNISDKFSENSNANKSHSEASSAKYKLDNRNKPHTASSTSSNESPASSQISTKVCKRCSKTFYINSADMSYMSANSECVYHWGKLRNVRFNRVVEQKYFCCSGSCNSEGCEVGNHVYDGEYDGHGQGTNLAGYVEVTGESAGSKTSANIYALDCEMCYTTRGLELTRVSVVDIHSQERYESLVKPNAQILDYNTRWSGLTKQTLEKCTKTLEMVQSDLLRLFNKDTILIGHSLESDFKALRLIHKNVVDTSVVFPHKMGPPIKRALRNLMSEYLQKIIQEDGLCSFLFIKWRLPHKRKNLVP